MLNHLDPPDAERETPAIQGPAASETPAAILAHHRRSGLDPERLGPLPERLERRSRPNPFRRYRGAPRSILPLATDPEPREISPTGRDLGRILEDALGLGGWKRVDNAGFGLRRVPSAGNLHPVESYVLAAGIEPESNGAESNDVGKGDPGAGRNRAALYHYSPFDHALERRRFLSETQWNGLRSACPGASAFFALSVIYWRTAWKYGERAFRLCQLDVGHAVAALDAAAAVSGRRVRWVDAADDDLALLLGLGSSTGPEEESTACLLALEARGSTRTRNRWRPDALADPGTALPSAGEPSPISAHHRHWPGVDVLARTTRRGRDDGPPGATAGATAPDATAPGDEKAPAWTREVLHSRRSRSSYEDRPLPVSKLHEMVARAVDGDGSCFPWPPERDLTVLLFIHRVETLEPGLYAARAHGAGASFFAHLSPELRPRQLPADGYRLEGLHGGDARSVATRLAGDQPAAGDGAFTVLVLARLREALEEDGPFAYRRLHWQAGELAHRLYLDGEARGLGVTGLGGFYEERLCALLGLRDQSWCPLYMVAVGPRKGPDPELEPPYAHRELGARPVPAFDGGYLLESTDL